MSEQSEQEQIRAEYLETHRHAEPIERAALEARRAALWLRCTHPNLGTGMLPGDYNQRSRRTGARTAGSSRVKGANRPRWANNGPSPKVRMGFLPR